MIKVSALTVDQGCDGLSQSPIDIPPPPESPAPEETPLVMTNYDQVRRERLPIPRDPNFSCPR